MHISVGQFLDKEFLGQRVCIILILLGAFQSNSLKDFGISPAMSESVYFLIALLTRDVITPFIFCLSNR